MARTAFGFKTRSFKKASSSSVKFTLSSSVLIRRKGALNEGDEVDLAARTVCDTPFGVGDIGLLAPFGDDAGLITPVGDALIA